MEEYGYASNQPSDWRRDKMAVITSLPRTTAARQLRTVTQRAQTALQQHNQLRDTNARRRTGRHQSI